VSRLLAVDLGERRIGLAVGDERDGLVRPLPTIRRGDLERDAAVLGRLVAEHHADTLLVGLPRNMDGSEGAQAAATRRWATGISAILGLPLCWRDERLTSVAAEAALGPPPRGRSGGPPSRAATARRRAAVDREAARRILQAELDARAGLGA
jgi:putative Holliday junction resolvase